MTYTCKTAFGANGKVGDIINGKSQKEIKALFPDTVRLTFLANQMTIWEWDKVKKCSTGKQLSVWTTNDL